MINTRRITSAAAQYLRKRVIMLEQAIMRKGARAVVRREIIDGFIVQVKKTKLGTLADVLDTPVIIAVPSNLINGNSELPIHHPLILEPPGRDFFLLNPGTVDAVNSTPAHQGSTSSPAVAVGTLFSGPVIVSTVRAILVGFDAVGFIQLQTNLYLHNPYTTNPYAFASRADRMVYRVNVSAPVLGRTTYQALANGWSADPAPVVPAVVPKSMLVSDSVIRGTSGSLPFCMRVAPPAYDPSDTAQTTYNNAQMPWSKLIVADQGVTDGGQFYYSVILLAHVVTEMLNDSDRFGAKGVWAGHLTCTSQEDPSAAPTVVLDWYVEHDMRDNADPRLQPYKSLGTGSTPPVPYYATNNVYPGMTTKLTLPDGSTLPVAVYMQQNYQTDPPNTDPPVASFDVWNGVYVARFGSSYARQLAVGPVPSAVDSFVGHRHDFAFPVGVDSEGAIAHALFFSTDVTRTPEGTVNTGPTSFDVIRITDSTATVVFSDLIPQRYCLANFDSRFECVRYIGNGKYLFVATDQIEYDVGFLGMRGDMVAMVYNSRTNTVSMVGTIDPIIKNGAASDRYTGSMDCVVTEQISESGTLVRKATVMLTFGGNAQAAGEGGGEIGETFITWDSGETWVKIATFGSPAGVRYCGTLLTQRTTEL